MLKNTILSKLIIFSGVVELVQHRTVNADIGGSSPPPGAISKTPFRKMVFDAFRKTICIAYPK